MEKVEYTWGEGLGSGEGSGDGEGSGLGVGSGEYTDIQVHKREGETTMATKKVKRYAIIANSSYGLFVGIVDKWDPKTGVAEVSECRHVRYWYGRTGGITSLAKWGLCGPNAEKSRIGAPCKATLTNVVNVFDCTSEAKATFEASVQS